MAHMYLKIVTVNFLKTNLKEAILEEADHY